jgi:hypothetical protein
VASPRWGGHGAALGRVPRGPIILAHCAISDLSWLWRELPDHPNLYIDTAWWAPADVLATFALCPPSNIVWASDSPYGRPIIGATQTMRMAFQAGLTPDQLRGVMGGQMEQVLAGEPRLELGPPPGRAAEGARPADRARRHPPHDRDGRAFVRPTSRSRSLWRGSPAQVGDDAPQAEVCSAVLELLDQFDENLAPPEEGRPIPAAARLLVFALIVARTPDVPIPALPDLPHATRARPSSRAQGRPGGLAATPPNVNGGWVGRRGSRPGRHECRLNHPYGGETTFVDECRLDAAMRHQADTRAAGRARTRLLPSRRSPAP